eukprot:7322652-Lingulodinium_polyedra.AAC.1
MPLRRRRLGVTSMASGHLLASPWGEGRAPRRSLFCREWFKWHYQDIRGSWKSLVVGEPGQAPT